MLRSGLTELAVWGIDRLEVATESGLTLCADRLAPRFPAADLLLVPGGKGVRSPRTLAKLSAWLAEHQHNFGRIVSVCTGAYALAEAGLLDGRRVTTHWAHARDLQARYPNIEVLADALYLCDDKYYSSGGVTAGIDLALELIQQDLGNRAATRVARELVVYLRRTGTQKQFSMPLQLQATASNRLHEVCQWAACNLEQDLSVAALASRVGLSSRHFSRRFLAEFGLPPAAYIKRLRLDTGRTLLEQGVSILRTVGACGFGSVDGFRRAFEDQFGIPPGEYQSRFSQLPVRQ